MWNFLFGVLFARATGISRIVRPMLWLLLAAIVIFVILSTARKFYVVTQRRMPHHVHAN